MLKKDAKLLVAAGGVVGVDAQSTTFGLELK
jgi:hypothetical protein